MKYILSAIITTILIIILSEKTYTSTQIIVSVSTENKSTVETVVLASYRMDAQPQDTKSLLLQQLSLLNLSQDEIEAFNYIAFAESGYRLDAIGPSVLHCITSNGKKYGKAYKCNDGDSIMHIEHPTGMFQILPSNIKGYKCIGLDTLENQLDCALKIYRRSGFHAWSTYKNYLKAKGR